MRSFARQSLLLALIGTSSLVVVPQREARAQSTIPDGAIQGIRWREIGPFRAGRKKSAVGVPTQPNVFYMAVTNGGVWKTNDAGRTWTPIFDAQATGSIGAVEVAPSDPTVPVPSYRLT